MKRAHKALLRGLLGLALLAAVLALADPARVLAQLRQAHIGWLLAGLAAGIASNLVSTLRWRALARWLGAEVSVRDATRWYFQAIGLNALLPGAVNPRQSETPPRVLPPGSPFQPMPTTDASRPIGPPTLQSPYRHFTG